MIPVTDESPPVRNTALAKGLAEVFVRLSGDSKISTRLTLPTVTGYVQQYSYQPITPTAVNNPVAGSDSAGSNVESNKFLLTVQYNGTRIINYLRDHGFPVWGEHRAVLVVWVAVRDGRHEYVLKKTDNSLIKTSIQKGLVRRGVPFRWPDYDRRDKKILEFTDILGGFRDPLEKVSARYARGPVAAISLSWDGSQWQSDWTLLFKNNEFSWSYRGANYNQLIQQAIDQMVDTMGGVYAVKELASGQSVAVLYMHVNDVNNINRYKRVTEYLNDIQAVKQVRVKRVDGKSIDFELTLRSDQAAFLSLLKNDAELIATATGNPTPALSPDNESTTITTKKHTPKNAIPGGSGVVGQVPGNNKKKTVYYFRLAE